MRAIVVALLFAVLLTKANAFVGRSPVSKPWGRLALAAEPFEITLNMPPTGSQVQAQLRFEPVLPPPSEIVEVRYKLPFGLDVAPDKNLGSLYKGRGWRRKGWRCPAIHVTVEHGTPARRWAHDYGRILCWWTSMAVFNV